MKEKNVKWWTFLILNSIHQEGEADTSFFSLDCFHISERAHAEMAIALWNNMVRMESSQTAETSAEVL